MDVFWRTSKNCANVTGFDNVLSKIERCKTLFGGDRNGHVGLLQALNGRKFNFLYTIAKRKHDYLICIMIRNARMYKKQIKPSVFFAS